MKLERDVSFDCIDLPVGEYPASCFLMIYLGYMKRKGPQGISASLFIYLRVYFFDI